jgi:hypothetical protein
MSTQKCLSQLTVYIEENLRTANRSGVPFVDPRQIRDRVITRQNHVIFGRRGAGKTTLLGSIARDAAFTTVYINLEDAKGATLARNLIHILSETFAKLSVENSRQRFWLNVKALFLRKKIQKVQKELAGLLTQEDSADIRDAESAPEANTENTQDDGTSEKEETNAGAERGSQRSLGQLDRHFSKYKKLFSEISKNLGHKAIYLALDDFYYVPRSQQPELLDYFHRLTKDTNLYLKVATVKDRSTLYRAGEQSHWGIELGHDAQEIDIDYTLQKCAEMESFLNELLNMAKKESGADIEIDACFKDDGFKQLCLASEGLPRTFLSLFVRIANKFKGDESSGPFIGAKEVLEEINFGTDAGTGGQVILRKNKKNFLRRFLDFLKKPFSKRKAKKPEQKEIPKEILQTEEKEPIKI